jgi:hypothetical protein
MARKPSAFVTQSSSAAAPTSRSKAWAAFYAVFNAIGILYFSAAPHKLLKSRLSKKNEFPKLGSGNC